MIYIFVPYAPLGSLNLGDTYNKCMGLIQDDDWACFIDHDAVNTTPDWYTRLESTVGRIEHDSLPIGLITGVTNRIGNPEQLVFDKSEAEAHNHDMAFHRTTGEELKLLYGMRLRSAYNPISGVVMLTSKKVWRQVGGFIAGFLGVDNDYDAKVRAAGLQTMIMDSWYIYHWYRADGKPLSPNGYEVKIA